MAPSSVKDGEASVSKEQLYTYIQQLQGQINHLKNKTDTIEKPSNKISKPEPFSGEKGNVQAFLTQLRSYFHVNKTIFAKEGDKTLFAGGLLTGRAAEWFEPTLRDYLSKEEVEQRAETKQMFNGFAKFAEQLRITFGNPDEQRTAERQLLRLRQTGSAGWYAAEFKQIAAKLDWGEQALIVQFYQGLKDYVKDDLTREERPDEIAKFMELAIRIDNRNFERRQERKGYGGGWQQRANHGQKMRPRSTAHGHHAGPMELDAAQREKTKKPKGNCFNCGKAGHFANKCRAPKKKPSFKPVPTKNISMATREDVDKARRIAAMDFGRPMPPEILTIAAPAAPQGPEHPDARRLREEQEQSQRDRKEWRDSWEQAARNHCRIHGDPRKKKAALLQLEALYDAGNHNPFELLQPADKERLMTVGTTPREFNLMWRAGLTERIRQATIDCTEQTERQAAVMSRDPITSPPEFQPLALRSHPGWLGVDTPRDTIVWEKTSEEAEESPSSEGTTSDIEEIPRKDEPQPTHSHWQNHVTGRGVDINDPRVLFDLIKNTTSDPEIPITGDHHCISMEHPDHWRLSWLSCPHVLCVKHFWAKIEHKWMPTRIGTEPLTAPYYWEELAGWDVYARSPDGHIAMTHPDFDDSAEFMRTRPPLRRQNAFFEDKSFRARMEERLRRNRKDRAPTPYPGSSRIREPRSESPEPEEPPKTVHKRSNKKKTSKNDQRRR